MTSSPSICRRSAAVEARCVPVAMRTTTSAGRITTSMMARSITARGCGRVTSQTEMATRWPGRARSRNRGPATGLSMAVRSVASGSTAAARGLGVMTLVEAAGSRTDRPVDPYASGTSIVAARIESPSGTDHAAAIDEPTNAVDLDDDHVPVVQEPRRLAEDADATRRPGRDDVAGLEGHEPRTEGNQVGDIVDHLGRGGVLEDLVVDQAADAQRFRIRQVVGRDDPRPDRAERVEALASHPLAVAELQVAGRHVVEAGVSQDVVERPGRRHVAGP